MKKRDIDIMVMAIGQADPVELRKYASNDTYIKKVDDFSDLDDSVLDQAELLCPSKLQRNCLVTTDKTSSGLYFWSSVVASLN